MAMFMAMVKMMTMFVRVMVVFGVSEDSLLEVTGCCPVVGSGRSWVLAVLVPTLGVAFPGFVSDVVGVLGECLHSMEKRYSR